AAGDRSAIRIRAPEEARRRGIARLNRRIVSPYARVRLLALAAGGSVGVRTPPRRVLPGPGSGEAARLPRRPLHAARRRRLVAGPGIPRLVSHLGVCRSGHPERWGGQRIAARAARRHGSDGRGRRRRGVRAATRSGGVRRREGRALVRQARRDALRGAVRGARRRAGLALDAPDGARALAGVRALCHPRRSLGCIGNAHRRLLPLATPVTTETLPGISALL